MFYSALLLSSAIHPCAPWRCSISAQLAAIKRERRFSKCAAYNCQTGKSEIASQNNIAFFT